MMAVFFADVVGQAADVEHPVATGAETELTVDTVAGHAVVEAFAKGETWQGENSVCRQRAAKG